MKTKTRMLAGISLCRLLLLLPVAHAGDAKWVGYQYAAGSFPDTGSFFDTNCWQNYSIPTNQDLVFFAVSSPPTNGNFRHSPHHLHFGDFGFSDPPEPPRIIPRGDASVSNLWVTAGEWVFDLGSSYHEGATPPPSPGSGTLTVLGEAYVRPWNCDSSTGRTSLTIRNGGLRLQEPGQFSLIVTAPADCPTAEVVVDGPDARILAVGDINLGNWSDSTGRLVVTNGAKIEAHAVYGWSQATVVVTGPGSHVDSLSGITDGTVLIERGGQATGGSFGFGLGWWGSPAAVATVRDPGSMLEVSSLKVGGYDSEDQWAKGTGVLNILDGGVVTSAFTLVAAAPQSSGQIVVSSPAALWTNTGTAYVGYRGTGGLDVREAGTAEIRSLVVGNGTTGTGMLTLSSGGQLRTYRAVLEAKGTARISGQNSVWQVGTDLTLTATGTNQASSLEARAGALVAVPSRLTVAAGTVVDLRSRELHGCADCLTSGGRLTLGDIDPASVSHGTAVFASQGSLSIGLSKEGDVLGGTFKADSIVFGGSLNITATGAALRAGDLFKPFQATTLSGQFANIHLPALDTGLGWDLSQLRTDGTLLVTPADGGPVIREHPADGTTVRGGTVRLHVLAQGQAPLTFQWTQDGVELDGETNAVLVLANIGPGQFGVYAVEVRNDIGAVLSRPAIVARLEQEAPRLVTQPIGRTVNIGGQTVLEADVEGQPPLTYQWRLNGENLPGATNATHAIPAFRLEDAGSYTVVVANAAGSVESDPAQVSPTGMPLLELVDLFADRRVFRDDTFSGLTNNLAATFEPGDNEPRHAGKVGGHSMWLTWKPRVSGVATFSTAGSGFDTLLAVYTGNALGALVEVTGDEDRGGHLTSALSFNAAAETEYHIAIDGFAGATGELILSWSLVPGAPPLPEITASPGSVVAAEGTTASLAVASPTLGATFQWLFNRQPLADATQPTLTFTATPARVGTYRARVTSADGRASTDSADALVEVVPAALPAPPAGETVSADKWPDLFAEEAPGRVRRHGRPTLMGFTSVTIGLGGRYTDLRAFDRGGSATRQATDPAGCTGISGVSRWFRFQVQVPQGVHFAITNSEVPVVLGVFEVLGNATMGRALLERGCAFGGGLHGPANVSISGLKQRDYLLLVATAGTGAGRVLVNWDGSEPLELAEPGIGFKDGRPLIEWIVVPGRYELRTAADILDWQAQFQTNVPSALFRYHDPEPVIHPARYYGLRHLPGGQ
jgi:T5SS/PEP-CTERM-associated repeat protein